MLTMYQWRLSVKIENDLSNLDLMTNDQTNFKFQAL